MGRANALRAALANWANSALRFFDSCTRPIAFSKARLASASSCGVALNAANFIAYTTTASHQMAIIVRAFAKDWAASVAVNVWCNS